MNLFGNRKILLSIRERPLPTLWLLACLAPYLIFSLAAAPHFHAADFVLRDASSLSACDSTRGDASALSQLPCNTDQSAIDCVLCQWMSHSNAAFGIVPLFIGLHAAAVEYSRSNSSPPLTSPVFADARGPPFHA
jgi:hypothetical protein